MRFCVNNLLPENKSGVFRPQNYKIGKQLGRNLENFILQSNQGGQTFYDTKSSATGLAEYKRLDIGIPNFRKYSIKRIGGPGFGGFYSKPISQERMFYPVARTPNSAVDYESMTARDEKMYTQSEFYKNIQLENTRQEREDELRAKKMNKTLGKIVL
jgi:hypothetical protein